MLYLTISAFYAFLMEFYLICLFASDYAKSYDLIVCIPIGTFDCYLLNSDYFFMWYYRDLEALIDVFGEVALEF